MALSFRPLLASDLAIAAGIQRVSNPRPAPAHDLARYLKIQPAGLSMVLLNDEPVGMGGVTIYGSVAWIGMMAVLPRVQRRGIGGMLLKHLIDRVEDNHCTTIVLDASDAGATLYAHFGFTQTDSSVLFELGAALLPPASRWVSPVTDADMDTLADFDACMFGANRRRVLEVYRSEAIGQCWLTRDRNGEVSGYLMMHDGWIGPWMAQTSRDARFLLGEALRQRPREGVRCIVPGANRSAHQVLDRFGFQPLRALPHMKRGVTEPADRTRIYAQASFAIG